MAPASLHTDIIGKHGPKAFLEMAASCGIALAGDVAIIGKDGQAIEILGD